MVTILVTSSVHTNIYLVELCMYTIDIICLEKEKYPEKLKKPVLT